MTLFVDTSTLLAASWSAKGLARLLIEQAEAKRWKLVTADYCLSEVEKNVGKHRRRPCGLEAHRSSSVGHRWIGLRDRSPHCF